jgi:nucleotide-binding universal stress UspA family protein
MQTLKRILVPVDFSECSLAAVDWATLLALRFYSEIDVLHVWNPSPFSLWTPYPGDTSEHLVSFDRELAGVDMKRILTRLESSGIPSRAIVESGDPLRTILRLAEEARYDVIVMGTHGRRGVSHLLLGSVAESVVRRAPCPVLTIRHHEHRVEVSAIGEPHTHERVEP